MGLCMGKFPTRNSPRALNNCQTPRVAAGMNPTATRKKAFDAVAIK